MKDARGVCKLLFHVEPVMSGEWMRFPSPFSPGDQTNAMAVHPGGGYRDHNSQKTGSLFDLYCELTRKRPSEARRELEEKNLIAKNWKYEEKITFVDGGKPEQGNSVHESDSPAVLDFTWQRDWTDIATQRSIPRSVFELCSKSRTLGYLPSYGKLGPVFAFVSRSTPLEDGEEIKGVALRPSDLGRTSSDGKKVPKWSTHGKYPIWTPYWEPKAKEVWITEGPWDAIALMSLFELYGDDNIRDSIQPMAIIGGKDIEKYSDVMEYLDGKTIVWIPDADEAGTKILEKCFHEVEQLESTQKILRIPERFRKLGCKDLNECIVKGFTKDDWDMWRESVDNFRMSNGWIIDSEYARDHGVSYLGTYEADPDDGSPLEIVTKPAEAVEEISLSEIKSLIKPFPLLHEYVTTMCECCDSPPIFHVMAFMTYMAAVMGRKFQFSESGLYPNLYTVCVGPSAVGKSVAISPLTRTIAKLLKGDQGTGGIMFPDLFSEESIYEAMGECSQKFFLAQEFSPWLNATEMSYKKRALGVFTNLFDAHQFTEDRPYVVGLRKLKLQIKEPIVSILGAMTDGQIQTSSDNLTGGLVARFNFVYAAKKNGLKMFPRLPPQDLFVKIENFFRLVAQTAPTRKMRFSEAAWAMIHEAHEKFDQWRKTVPDNDLMQGALNRWVVQNVKFSMILECLMADRRMPCLAPDAVMGEVALKAALRLSSANFNSFVILFKDQYRHGGKPTFSSTVQKRIFDCIARKASNEGVRKRDIMRCLTEKADVVDAHLASMVFARTIFEKKIKKKGSREYSVFFLVKDDEDQTLKTYEKNGAHHVDQKDLEAVSR